MPDTATPSVARIPAQYQFVVEELPPILPGASTLRARQLLDRERSRSAGFGTYFMASTLAILVAVFFFGAFKYFHSSGPEVEPDRLVSSTYESPDRTSCADVAATGGTCRSPMPRR